jgi:hypothetical protein
MVAQHGALAPTELQHEATKERFLRTATSKNSRTDEQEAENPKFSNRKQAIWVIDSERGSKRETWGQLALFQQ